VVQAKATPKPMLVFVRYSSATAGIVVGGVVAVFVAVAPLLVSQIKVAAVGTPVASSADWFY